MREVLDIKMPFRKEVRALVSKLKTKSEVEEALFYGLKLHLMGDVASVQRAKKYWLVNSIPMVILMEEVVVAVVLLLTM